MTRALRPLLVALFAQLLPRAHGLVCVSPENYVFHAWIYNDGRYVTECGCASPSSPPVIDWTSESKRYTTIVQSYDACVVLKFAYVSHSSGSSPCTDCQITTNVVARRIEQSLVSDISQNQLFQKACRPVTEFAASAVCDLALAKATGGASTLLYGRAAKFQRSLSSGSRSLDSIPETIVDSVKDMAKEEFVNACATNSFVKVPKQVCSLFVNFCQVVGEEAAYFTCVSAVEGIQNICPSFARGLCGAPDDETLEEQVMQTCSKQICSFESNGVSCSRDTCSVTVTSNCQTPSAPWALLASAAVLAQSTSGS